LDDFNKVKQNARPRLSPDPQVTIPKDVQAQVENAIYEFQSMYSVLGGLVYYFTLLPSDLLTLGLVVSMGILGSSLQLSYIYVTEFASRPTSFYILRPFLGAITSFVIFIAAKAGIPLITDVARVGANAPINPYFISFLAIISGLLSERALETLRRVGATYFREGDGNEPARWARDGMLHEFEVIKRDPKTLLEPLRVKESELGDWLAGKEPMPKSAQVLIAAVLNKPRRDLFTDLPPPGQENPVAE
jgi:hypothetical protein